MIEERDNSWTTETDFETSRIKTVGLVKIFANEFLPD